MNDKLRIWASTLMEICLAVLQYDHEEHALSGLKLMVEVRDNIVSLSLSLLYSRILAH